MNAVFVRVYCIWLILYIWGKVCCVIKDKRILCILLTPISHHCSNCWPEWREGGREEYKRWMQLHHAKLNTKHKTCGKLTHSTYNTPSHPEIRHHSIYLQSAGDRTYVVKVDVDPLWCCLAQSFVDAGSLVVEGVISTKLLQPLNFLVRASKGNHCTPWKFVIKQVWVYIFTMQEAC